MLLMFEAFGGRTPAPAAAFPQGMRLRKNDKMPTKQILFAERGRPPLGFGFETRMKGSINSHNLSGKRRRLLLRILYNSCFAHAKAIGASKICGHCLEARPA